MTTVFVSGSRSIHFLPTDALAALDRILAQGFLILVGDCAGSDVATQRYLKSKAYRAVTVCHIGARPRHNLGFNSMQVEGTRQTDKDSYMGRTANYGLAIWDGTSPGTARNIQRVKTKVVIATDSKTCVSCSKTGEIGSTGLPVTFHAVSNPKIAVCFECYRSGKLADELKIRGFAFSNPNAN